MTAAVRACGSTDGATATIAGGANTILADATRFDRLADGDS